MCLTVTGTPAPVIAKLQDTFADVVQRPRERVEDTLHVGEYL